MDVWFVGQVEPRRYKFKPEDYKRFEIANREWLNSTRRGAEFSLDEGGKAVVIRIDRIIRREVISVTDTPSRPQTDFPLSSYGLTRRTDQ